MFSLIESKVNLRDGPQIRSLANFYPEEDDNLSCLEGNCDNNRPRQDLKTASLAIKAAENAREAQDAQKNAGSEAAQEIKAKLADKAAQAVMTVEAALSGKQVLVDQLEHEVREAEAVVQEEVASCQRTQTNMQIAFAAATQAGHMLETLTAALQLAQVAFMTSRQTAEGTQKEVMEKAALVEAAKARADALLKELSVATQDLNTIKQAAQKAEAAAKGAATSVQKRKKRKQGRRRRKRRNGHWIKRMRNH